MKKIIFLVFFILISFSYAQDSLYNYQNLDLDLSMKSDLEISGRPNSNLDYLKIKLYLYPESGYHQQIISLSTSPDYVKKDDYLELMWAENRLGKYNYELISDVKTYNKFPIISNKISFPIQNIDQEYLPYLDYTEKIDSNQDIINRASELAEGEDDLYQVVFNLAEWVKQNINYNITTLTAEASEPASWVLENKYGVCDELTNLFIAFCRSLGIPARFVSGISYTNSDIFENDWGLHGWAEVYFPDIGWVSFDPTYGQFGYIDATHIKLRDSYDSDKSSTKFEWQGTNVDLSPGATEINVDVKKYGNKLNKVVDLQVIPYSSEISLDSFNLVQAKVKNLKNYYVSTELVFSAPVEIELHDIQEKTILLKPYEEKSVYWIIKTDDLKKNYIYTFPIEIYDSFGYSGKGSFQAKTREITYTFGQVWELLNNIQEQEQKTYSKNIELNCKYPESVFYNESFNIICNIKNKGNIMLDNLKICIENNCNKTSLGISQAKNISFSHILTMLGEKELTISAKNTDITKSAQLRIIVEDKPKLIIKNVQYPELLEYGPGFEINFAVHKESLAPAKDVEVEFSFNNKKDIWKLDEIESVQKFNVKLDKTLLNLKDNSFKILIKYHDKDNNLYIENFEQQIPIKEPTIWQKVLIWISEFARDLEQVFV